MVLDSKEQDRSNVICEKDIDNLKHQCKNLSYRFSKIIKELAEEIDDFKDNIKTQKNDEKDEG